MAIEAIRGQKTIPHNFKPAIESLLLTRGLELSNEKTIITHIDNGFDFLGFNVRKYHVIGEGDLRS